MQDAGKQRAAETRQRLEEASRKKVEDERVAAAQRHQKREYKTGKLTGGLVIGRQVGLFVVDEFDSMSLTSRSQGHTYATRLLNPLHAAGMHPAY